MKFMEYIECNPESWRNLFESTKFKDLTEYFIKFHLSTETFSQESDGIVQLIYDHLISFQTSK